MINKNLSKIPKNFSRKRELGVFQISFLFKGGTPPKNNLTSFLNKIKLKRKNIKRVEWVIFKYKDQQWVCTPHFSFYILVMSVHLTTSILLSLSIQAVHTWTNKLKLGGLLPTNYLLSLTFISLILIIIIIIIHI